MPDPENQKQDPGLREVLLGQFRALVRKASPSEEELGALARACLKLGVDPGPLYLEAQRQVPRPESFAPLPRLEEVLPHGPEAFPQKVSPEHLAAQDVKEAVAEGKEAEKRAEAKEE